MASYLTETDTGLLRWVLPAGTGVAVGLGLRSGFQLLTAAQDGVDRLAEPVEVDRSGLRFEVREVVVSRDFTRVRLAVANHTGKPRRCPPTRPRPG